MRKTKTEIGKRERNEENKNRKERERGGNGKPTFQWRTEMPPNGNAGRKKRESRGERKRESRGEISNVTYQYYRCNLSYQYHSNAYKLKYISYHSNSSVYPI